MKIASAFILMALVAAPAYAQVGAVTRGLSTASNARKAVEDFVFTPEEKRALGEQISAQLRQRFGVVQDPKVTKYVSLVGTLLAKSSAQPSLNWQFIVLDTDGVNAYAAPGGLVHITRGALGFIRNEAELAGVLGHEIGHVTADHTVKAIKKAQGAGLVANATRSQVIDYFANKGYEIVFENGFDRGDEVDADKRAVEAAGKAGYSATALSGFLDRLADRNKDVKESNGLFASHPVIKERTGKIATAAKSGAFASAAIVQPRYASNVSYKPIPLASVATVAAPAGSASATTAENKPSLGGRLRGALSTGAQKESTAVSASAGARGVGPDRDAKGGPNKGAVIVRVTDAELATFKAGIA